MIVVTFMNAGMIARACRKSFLRASLMMNDVALPLSNPPVGNVDVGPPMRTLT